MKRLLLILVTLLAFLAVLYKMVDLRKGRFADRIEPSEVVSEDYEQQLVPGKAEGIGTIDPEATNPAVAAGLELVVSTNQPVLAERHGTEVPAVVGETREQPKDLASAGAEAEYAVRAEAACRANMERIIRAAIVWCQRNSERLLPPDLMAFPEELGSPIFLLCPAAKDWSRKATTNWVEFRPEWISYRVHASVKSGGGYADFRVSGHYIRCPVHRLEGLRSPIVIATGSR